MYFIDCSLKSVLYRLYSIECTLPSILTHNRQPVGETNFGLRGDLTLVDAGIAWLHRHHLEHPLVGVVDVAGQKALIVGIGHDADGQYVQVTLSYPRDSPIPQMAHSAVHAGCGAEGGDNLSLGAVVELRLVLLGYGVGQLGGESCTKEKGQV